MSKKAMGTVLGTLIGAVMLVTLFQNCARVGLSSRDLQKGLDGTNTIFACTETSKTCEKDGQQGTMSCTSTPNGPQWGECIIPGGGDPTPLGGCTFKGMSYVHGQSFVAYQTSSVVASGMCSSELRTCLNGAITGSYQYLSCMNDSGQCNIAGSVVQHNQTIETFEAASVAYGQTCKKEIRRCFDGALTGTYNFLSCIPDTAASCVFNNQLIPHLGEVLAYQSESVSYQETCLSQKRSCNNGVLGGTYTAASCVVNPPAVCKFNGQDVPHQGQVTAYETATVPFGGTCKYQQRTCTNGSLSGTYTNASCAVQNAQTCNFNGQTIAHNGTVTAYQTTQVPFGATCASQVRTCTNGSLSGTYTAYVCTTAPPATCSFNGQTIAHSGTIKTYSTTSVPFGSTCESVAETRTCVNGALNGSAQYVSCVVREPATCTFNGQTVAHGASVKAYFAAQVTSPDSCPEESRYCNNGNLGGSYGYPGCTVYTPPTANCSIYYQARNDSKVSGTGSNGSWATYHSDANSDCNDYPGCGIRVGVSCTGEAQLRLKYQFKSFSTDSAETYTPWSGTSGGIQWGDWSLIYKPGHPSAECKAPLQCGIRIAAEVMNGKTCSVSYNYKVDKGNYTPVQSDGAWSVLSRGSGQGDNCDDKDCGLQAKLTCQTVYTPPEGGFYFNGVWIQIPNYAAHEQMNDGRLPASAEPVNVEMSFWSRVSNWFVSMWTAIFG